MSPGGAWGPFRPALDEPERRAELRALRCIVRLTCGPRGYALAATLEQAERDPVALGDAASAIDRLPSLDRRAVMSAFAAAHRPGRGGS